MTDLNQETTTTQASSPAKPESLTYSLYALGAAWARYGLSVGKLALETSAKTLEGTSKILGSIADSLEPKKPQS